MANRKHERFLRELPKLSRSSSFCPRPFAQRGARIFSHWLIDLMHVAVQE